MAPGRRAVFVVGLIGSFSLIYLPLLFIEPHQRIALTREDGPIENLSSVCFAIAAIGVFYAYLQSAAGENRFWGYRTRRNIWLVLLALLFLVCFGEEISWGQRLFGWQTPDSWADMNAQHETNLHNLWLFQAYNSDKSRKSSIELMLNANRLLSVFWVSYCVLLPLVELASDRAKSLFRWVGLPIPPLMAGALFIASYTTFQLIVAFAELDSRDVSAFNEFKESTYAAAFAILAFYFVRSHFVASKTSASSRGWREASPLNKGR